MRHWWPPEWDEKGVKEQIWREQLTQDFRDWFIEIGVLEQEDDENT
jgi:elongation factor P--beta-lysine ligase